MVVDGEREMPKVAPRLIGHVLVPVVGQLDLGGIVGGAAAQEHERETTALALAATHLPQTELVAEETERVVEVFDAQHRVQESHPADLISCACR